MAPDQPFSCKAKEALIGVKLDRTRSKNEILQGHLSTVYFGRGAVGIQAAARNYFGIDADQLSLVQGSALAAIINLPLYYERAGAETKVTPLCGACWTWVLDGIAQCGAITSDERARAVFPVSRFYPPGQIEGQRQYLLDAAAAEATDRLHISPDELARGGYTVTPPGPDTYQAATSAERNDCPMCEAPAGSPCRSRGGRCTTKYHTARFIRVPALREELDVLMLDDRGPGRPWGSRGRPSRPSLPLRQPSRSGSGALLDRPAGAAEPDRRARTAVQADLPREYSTRGQDPAEAGRALKLARTTSRRPPPTRRSSSPSASSSASPATPG